MREGLASGMREFRSGVVGVATHAVGLAQRLVNRRFDRALSEHDTFRGSNTNID